MLNNFFQKSEEETEYWIKWRNSQKASFCQWVIYIERVQRQSLFLRTGNIAEFKKIENQVEKQT